MKNLNFTIPNNLNLLHDELIAGVPDLRPIERNGSSGDFVPQMGVQGIGDEIFLSVPDHANVLAIEAVIEKHNATKHQIDLVSDALASGRKKLSALGLTDEEINAIVNS